MRLGPKSRPGSLLKGGDEFARSVKRRKDAIANIRKEPAHLEYIRQLPCLVTGRLGVDAAHISYTDRRCGKTGRGMGQKEHDRWTVPLSHHQHMRQHSYPGGERAFWEDLGIDPCYVAMALWGVSGDIEAGTEIISLANQGRSE